MNLQLKFPTRRPIGLVVLVMPWNILLPIPWPNKKISILVGGGGGGDGYLISNGKYIIEVEWGEGRLQVGF